MVAAYLQRRGWRVLARNWRCRLGEIDLVARDPDGVAVVCEVKARTGLGFGDPLEAITYAKRQRLRQLATSWRRASGLAVSSLRVDAVGILMLPGSAPLIRHVRGVA